MTDNMTYNPESDLWTNESGRIYIKNEFNPESPQWIDITTPYWCISYKGKANYIDWDSIALTEGLLLPLKIALMKKMKKMCPDFLGMTRNSLVNFKKLVDPNWRDFSDISATDMAIIWQGLKQRYRLNFREIYHTMVVLGIGGTRSDIDFEIKHWKARHNVLHLRDVLQWHETRGALTSPEEKVLRATLKTKGIGAESDKAHATRIFAWLLLDTLKRPSQVLDIRLKGLKKVENGGKSEWFVEIQPIKFQTGLPSRWWQITEELALEIVSFSKRKRIAELQEKFDRLIVWDAPCLLNHGVISAADAKSSLTNYITKRRPISPRTGKPLHITPTRIRHTGATRLAFQGVSRDLIQEILEHDSPESAQAYIDAIGSEIIPAIEKASRNVGNIFFELNKGFFRGRLIHEIVNQPPIVVPESSPTPIIVGSCGRDTLKDGVCPKHPFLSCYDGCNCFFAWDNPDPHGKALRHFEKEIDRWEQSQKAAKQKCLPHAVADQAVQSYKRAAGAANEILSQIHNDN